ncbi:DCC1-like thiol-disulfide oxidoreductase family protein [Leptospira sp. GIMC2001]|uniref:DCC1-like thiol-disulfide oxidoreductase family protein n=1 Tax=Leptospira sp. GIMC2001 TaxID=1513297 RepID=UPI00234B66F8|nr:DCC1-like thiol-disulfide oxidoreductase family protein [Leptospira sp. GIMC2001]WCL47955.1 DCC1-like thiol-disulfide oxidoreductase family protein [Leptospira sp. GIMC2001]
MKHLFLYDGNCEFCTGLASSLEIRCEDKQVEFRSFRNLDDLELAKIHPNLNKDLCEGNVQFIKNSKRYPGFFAVRKLSQSLKIYKYFFWILYLPLVPFIGMGVMYLLKSIRNRE